MGYVTFTEFRNNLASHLNKVENDKTELVVTRQNHEPMVIVSLAEWESMKETLHVLGTPANVAHLVESISAANAGYLVERDLVEK